MRTLTTRTIAALLAGLTLPLASLSCGGGSQGLTAEELLLQRERAASYYSDDALGRAWTELEPVLSSSSADATDLAGGAAILLEQGDLERAEEFLERAKALDPQHASVTYLTGHLHRARGEFAEARAAFEDTLRAVPGDLATKLALADVQQELGATEEAKGLYQELVALGLPNGEAYYLSAVYRLGRLELEAGNSEAGEEYLRVFQGLQSAGAKLPPARLLARGALGRLEPPRPTGSSPAISAETVTFGPATPIPIELQEVIGLEGLDLQGDGTDELLVHHTEGLTVLRRNGKGSLEELFKLPACSTYVAFDFGTAAETAGDGDLDFLLQTSAGLVLYQGQAEGEGYSVQALDLTFEGWTPADALIALDFDHEGDMDVLAVGPAGVRLWRSDGADSSELGGRFLEISGTTGLPTEQAFEWALEEDFDGDNDVDVLLGGAAGVVLADSLREEQFRTKTGALPAGFASSTAPVAVDFNGDARVDLYFGSQAEPLLVQNEEGAFKVAQGATPRLAQPLSRDLDLDGSFDLVGVNADGIVAGQLALRTPAQRAFETSLSTTGPLAAIDFAGDGSSSLVTTTAAGLSVSDLSGTPKENVRLRLQGRRDNRRGIGSIVEYRAGAIYRRIYWRGAAEHLGVGSKGQLDVLRVTWPNGVVQNWLDVQPGAAIDPEGPAPDMIFQSKGLVGSCPFLYTWNGEEHVFVSDVLGITPLGLPIARGVYVPPDHDEYVLVTGEQLVPHEGKLKLVFTEELREVTYLDQARMEVIDHPEGTEIYPNERFQFPPFPEHEVHAFGSILEAQSVTDAEGRDWTEVLREVDDEHAFPFTPMPDQFPGLTEPWTLELEFPAEGLAQAERLRLVCTGWFLWSDASANVAASGHPSVDFIPPILQVPVLDEHGVETWVPTGPPVGFPAGKSKTMVIDVTDFLDREHPRLRMFSTLRLHWDALRLAVDGAEVPLVTTRLEVESSSLFQRGFSRPIEAPEISYAAGRPERFAYDDLETHARWDMHPGRYTRYGSVTPLLGEIDDMYAILGAGDALSIEFDATTLPALPEGWRRDYLVFLDGWAKDRDQNTTEALEVTPLPFHGMSGYPYSPEESYPSDAEHEAYRAEWNTREALRWIAPVSPARQREWLAGQVQ